MNILGISAFYHNSAAALIRDGEIIAAAQEERFTQKHDSEFPINAVSYCIKEGGITADKLDLVVFYEKPLIKFERILQTYLAYAPVGLISFLKAIQVWLRQKLWIPDIIRKELNYQGKIIFTEHHESHAASAFFPSPFEKAAFLTFDAAGEWTTASFGVGAGNKIKIMKEMKFPHSLELLYSAFTYYLGFKVNSGEYKVMELAPYGEPKYMDIIYKKLIDLKQDGSFRMNMKYFDYSVGLKMINSSFEKLFGKSARVPETKVEQFHMDIAASIQKVTEEIMMRMANYVHVQTGMDYLCLAGGIALNCVANGKILREGPFKDIWIQPAAGDAGGALGAALFAWYDYLGNERKAEYSDDFQKASLLGPEFSDEEIEQFLKSKDAVYKKLKKEEIPEAVSSLIMQGNVIGWFQGKMEYGPRALGSRSIIGDARSPQMQSIMNLRIKYRESFRPFAPTVLEEKVSDYFELDRKSPYMLLVADVKPDKRKDIEKNGKKGFELLKQLRSEVPAITHVDYSARVQTVNKRENPLYHGMINKFYEKTGCPVIINTSFNRRGEPIVCAPEHAFNCFMKTEINYLIMGSFLLDKKEQKMDVEKDKVLDNLELD